MSLDNTDAADALTQWLLVFNQIPPKVEGDKKRGLGSKSAKKIASQIKEIKQRFGKASKQPNREPQPSSTSSPCNVTQ